MTTPEGPGHEADGSPEPDVFAPAPIIPPGAEELGGMRFHGGEQVATETDADTQSPGRTGEALTERPPAKFWQLEVHPARECAFVAWKKPLQFLCGVFALEAALAVAVIVGTFVGLGNDRALAAGRRCRFL